MNPHISVDIASSLPAKTENGCQLLFLFNDGKLTGSSKKINSASNGLVKRLFASKDFTGQISETLVMHEIPGSSAQRLLLIGMGDRKNFTANTWHLACAAGAAHLHQLPAKLVIADALVAAKDKHLDPAVMAETLVREIIRAGYRFNLHPLRKPSTPLPLQRIILVTGRHTKSATQKGAINGRATAYGMAKTRDLGNLAPNICTPAYLAKTAVEMDKQYKQVKTEILDEKAMQSLGMGAFLAVSQGSANPGRMIVMHYKGKKSTGSPIVLVGKGVTFDTGGISIKPSEAMDEMKYDMCGAASVFGVIEALALQQAAINVVGLVAAAENMLDGKATRPGDVVTSMSGQSIEILNTDAEGRLVLCDALTYAERFKPGVVIDIATLTGASVIALGKSTGAIMGNHQKTIDALIKAGARAIDPVWQLPINDTYQRQLDSNFADMANIGGRPAGAITAACFLARFAEKFKWAHLDIAGVAWNSGKDKGATGRPVPLLMNYLNSLIK